MSPRAVDAMSLWEFIAVSDGLQAFHGGKKRRGPDLSEAKLAEMGIVGFGDGDG